MAIKTEKEYYQDLASQKMIINELNEREILHKYNVLKVKIMQYYQDLVETNCNCISDYILYGNFEKIVNKELIRLIMNPKGLSEFNRLYEIAYNELVENAEF